MLRTVPNLLVFKRHVVVIVFCPGHLRVVRQSFGSHSEVVLPIVSGTAKKQTFEAFDI